MYTVRDRTKSVGELDATLAKIAAIGYEGVQLSAVACLDDIGPKRARELLRKHGLVACATHRSFQKLTEDTAAEIEFHRELWCDYVAIGVPPPGLVGTAGWRAWIASLVPLLDRLQGTGLSFGYHNHDFEFQGEPSPYDLLLLDADLRLQLELDTYWVEVGGADLLGLIERAAGRLRVVHVKDRVYDPDGKPRFAPVGEGDLSWREILPAFRKAGTQWLVVEQDETYGRDPFDALAASYGFLKRELR